MTAPLIGGSAFDSAGRYDERAALAHDQENHVVAAGPDWQVIMPEALLTVRLPQALIVDVVNYYAREMAARKQAHNKEQSFDEWIADLLRDRIYGSGNDAGAAADWIERR